MHIGKIAPTALAVALLAAACGGSSGDENAAGFMGTGPSGGAAQGCVAPFCDNCDTCLTQQVCNGTSAEIAVAVCTEPDACAAPATCYDECLCANNPTSFCDAKCNPQQPPPQQPPPQQPPPQQPPPAAGCASDGSGWEAGWQQFECRVLELTNQRRAQGAVCGGQPFGPAGPLGMQPQLRASSRGHSQDMALQNFFDHNNPHTGTNPFQRMQAAGFQGGTMGENIASGQTSPEQVVQGWMDSPGHCQNIMNPTYRFLGVGYFFSPTSGFRHFWTQNFGG